jgi:hypothetical protein
MVLRDRAIIAFLVDAGVRTLKLCSISFSNGHALSRALLKSPTGRRGAVDTPKPQDGRRLKQAGRTRRGYRIVRIALRTSDNALHSLQVRARCQDLVKVSCRSPQEE